MAYYKAGSLYFAQNSNVVVDNVSGDIANFNTPLCLPLLETKLGFSAKQDLHGYDSPWMDSTVLDKKPYLLQPISGTASRYGNYLYDKIIGGTVAFNQLFELKTGTYDGLSGTIDSSGLITISGTSAQTYSAFSKNIAPPTGHKLLIGKIVVANPNEIPFLWTLFNVSKTPYVSANKNTQWNVINITSGGVSTTGISGFPVGTDFTGVKIKLLCIDLTQMFGSIIADYIYSLEQSTAGAGVAFFRNLFPEDYYAYNAGELISVKTSKHITTGFNQWDEEWLNGYLNATAGEYSPHDASVCSKNFNKVVRGARYFIHKASGVPASYICWYDSDQQFIKRDVSSSDGAVTPPDNAAYFKFSCYGYGTTYNGNVCINVYNSARNGQYEPYSKHEYPLDSDLELRGIPKLDANNNLYYDGDIYESSGKVTRKYGVVDLSTLTWNTHPTQGFYLTNIPSDMKRVEPTDVPELITEKYTPKTGTYIYGHPTEYKCIGQNTVQLYITDTSTPSGYLIYELATPTTETADAFTNPQVSDQYGTEEYLDSRTIPIPVGHETYQANICPIEGVSEVNYTHYGKNQFPNANVSGTTNARIELQLKAGQYTFSAIATSSDTDNTVCGVLFQYADDSYDYMRTINRDTRQSFVINLTKDTKYIYLYASGSYQQSQDDTFTFSDVQIEVGNTASTYEPYVTPTTALIQLGDTYYGGEVIIDKDGKRKIKATWASVDMGSLSYTSQSSGSGAFFEADIANIKPLSAWANKMKCLSPIYTQVTGNDFTGNPTDCTMSGQVNYHNIRVRNLSYSSGSELRAAMTGILLVYELDTPIIIDLPDGAVIKSIPAVNNIFCDTGDTAIKFRKIGE